MTIITKNKAWTDLKANFKRPSPSVQVGVFSEQGIHSGSGRTYVDLLQFHHYGGDRGQVPERPVLSVLKGKVNLKDRRVRTALKAWSKRPLGKDSDNILLKDIGKYLRDEGKDIFGSSQLEDNTSYTQEQKGRNDPLVDTGDLRDHFAFRTSIDNIIMEG